ncbi:MAG TPA: hypothetical protein DHW61_11960 [Lachnoclostridium phytofermentans]|uniref:Uncharacterized protein n=1 Tax=Lachnoclostridium phytofermentans TaxID=66219 RepID=A0A3D2X7K7_9FIRM|nr:hypothetical protein [Lachnoclostridium sp.]HCL03101.1 hypothetical protein [Lachnoclostridium phytofermentans]
MEIKRLEHQLERNYNEWTSIYNGNGKSPWYADGWSCNSIRKTIIDLKNWMKRIEPDESKLPEIYHRKLPVPLDDNLMLNSRKLLHSGNQGLANRKKEIKEEPVSFDDWTQITVDQWLGG